MKKIDNSWFYTHCASTADEFFKFTEGEPYPVMRALIRTLKQHEVGTFKVAQNEEKDGTVVAHFGMGWGGKDTLASIRRKNCLIIHWPTLMSRLPLFILENCPAITAFVWQYSDLIAHKSPLAYELYRRKIVVSLSKVFPDVTVLNPLIMDEEKTLSSLQGLLTNEKMSEICRAALQATWGEIVDDRLSARKWAVEGTGYHANDVSLIDVEAFKIRAFRRRKVKINIPFISGNSFPKHARPFLYEIYLAAHLRSVQNGVFRADNPENPLEPKCLIINLREYVRYRSELNTTYTSLSPQSANVLKHPWDDAMFFQQEYLRKYPNLIYSGGAVIFKEEVSSVWPTHSPHEILYINMQALYNHALMAFNLERVRKSRKQDPSAINRAPRVFEVDAPNIPEFAGKDYKVMLFKKGMYIYMHPSWPIAFNTAEYHTVSDEVRRAKFAGLMYLEQLDSFFFTYRKLMEVDREYAQRSRALANWLESLATIDMDELRRTQRTRRRRDLINCRGGRDPNFTEEELDAIKKMVRPGMTNEQKSLLRAICGGRKWEKIALKAAQLRKEMLAAGIKDMSQIPFLNYNSKLRSELGVKTVSRKK